MSIVEHGSSIEYEPSGTLAPASHHHLDGAGLTFFGTARQALIALSRTLAETSGLKRVLLPDHYCHSTTRSVSAALATNGVGVDLYPATFGTPVVIATESSDLVVVNATFGVLPDGICTGPGIRVLDATHAPELVLLPGMDSSVFRFDFAFASLRKLLPVTDGGVLRAIGSLPLPSRPSSDSVHEEQARELEQLLRLKKRYVDGGPVDKTDFYPAIKELESLITQRSSPCAMSEVATRQLRTIDIAAAVRTARRNVEHVGNLLRGVLSRQGAPLVEIRKTETFVAMLCIDASTKQTLAEKLARQHVYAATLWPADSVIGVSVKTQDFVNRLIILNADLRYSTEHMTSATKILLASLRSLEDPNTNY